MPRTNVGWRRSRGHSEGKGEERMEHPLREGRKKGDVPLGIERLVGETVALFQFGPWNSTIGRVLRVFQNLQNKIKGESTNPAHRQTGMNRVDILLNKGGMVA